MKNQNFYRLKSRNFKERNNGITLVALVVTIIVLLILAGITITLLFSENGIIKKAQKAKDETENATKDELQQIENLGDKINEIIDGNASNNKWTQNSDGSITGPDGTTLHIGDYINYSSGSGAGATASYTSYAEANASSDKNAGRTSGYTEDQVFNAKDYAGDWRVLGVNANGQLEIMAATNVTITSGGNSGKYYYLKGQKGYTEGEAELNAISAIYGKGTGAVSARSINVDDINKITGFNPNNVGVKDPTQSGSGEKFMAGEIYEYGNEVTYSWDGTANPYYSGSNGKTGNLSNTHNSFNWYDTSTKTWKTSAQSTTATTTAREEITTLVSNSYGYYPTTLSLDNDLTASVGISSSSSEYATLFKNTLATDDTNQEVYWLGSSHVGAYADSANFGMRFVSGGTVGDGGLYYSGGTGTGNFGVRPVVSLSSDIQLENANTQKDGCNSYNIVK